MRFSGLAFACLAIIALPCHVASADQILNNSSTGDVHAQARRLADGQGRAENDLELGPGDKVLITAYERIDLSGKFTVRADGTVSIPLIGSIRAAGRTLSELDRATSAAIMKATSRSVPVSLEVDTWRPVYAVGDVDKPGVYPFTPGMTVLHALAASGGLARPLSNASPIELNREMAIVHRALEKLKTATAAMTRIEAELNGKETIDLPIALVEIAGPMEAKRLIAAELSILRQHTKTRKVKGATKLAEIELTKREISAYKKQRLDLKKRINLNMEELKKYTKLQAKGLARSSRTLQLRSEIAALEGTSHTVLASIARAQNSMIRITEEKNLLPVTTRLELDKEMQVVQGEIRATKAVLSLYSDLANQLSALSIEEAAALNNPATFEIMRSKSNQQKMIPAKETTLLRPGDVVRVLKPAAPVSNRFGDMLKRRPAPPTQ